MGTETTITVSIELVPDEMDKIKIKAFQAVLPRAYGLSNLRRAEQFIEHATPVELVKLALLGDTQCDDCIAFRDSPGDLCEECFENAMETR